MDEPAPPLKVLYFAWLRDRLGIAEEQVALPPEVKTVELLRVFIADRSPRHQAAFALGAVIRCAVNQNIAGPDHAVAPGDEVAFFPPVTGG